MRSEADVRRVLVLAASGHTRTEIARRVGISRSTVRAWLAGGEAALAAKQARRHDESGCAVALSVDEPAYAYLLGQYLGDGCISRVRSSFRLRLTCCDDYPKIIDECAASIRRVRPDGQVGYLHRQGCTEVSSYWLHWPRLLPHGSGGVKHQRAIELATWQRTIVLHRHPELFVRGLIHSDGWRGTNRVHGANGCCYEYPRYQFSNRSDDIKRLFCEACDRLGVEWRRMNAYAISVAKSRSVALLDEFVGPKD